MAAPVIQGTAETAVSTAGTSHAITLPANIVSTDLVLIISSIGSTSATFNALTDWTELLDENAAIGLKIIYYTGAGVPSTPTFTSSAATRSASIAYRISGADKSTAPQIGTTATATSANPNPPSVTPTGGVSKDYLFIAFFGGGGEEADDDTWADVSPTNYTPSPPLQIACGIAGSNLGGLLAAASRTNTSGSAEDPGTFTQDVSRAWRAQTIIVHPDPNAVVTPATVASVFTVPTPAILAEAVVTPATVASVFAVPTPDAIGGEGGLSYTELLDSRVVLHSGTSGSGDYTSGSFTTADDTLLVAVIRYDNQNSDISAAIPTPTTSGLTWVKKASIYNTGRNFSAHAEIWMADNATGGSKTIAQSGTGAWDTGTHAVDVTILEFTGAAAVADQPGATASTASTSGSARDPGAQSITLSAAPATGSYVVAAFAGDSDNAATVTHGTGWTETSDQPAVVGSQFLSSQAQLRTGSTSTTVGWDDLNATGAGTYDYVLLAAEVEKAAGGGATPTPDTVASVFAVPTPSILAASLVEPATVASVFTIPTPSAVGGTAVNPDTVIAVFTVPTPAILAASTVTPATVASVFAVPTPAVLAAALVEPATVVSVFTIPTPTIDIVASATVTPATVASVFAVDTPTILAGALVAPATVVAVFTVPTPTIDVAGGAVTVTPDTVVAVYTVPTPTPTAPATAAPLTVVVADTVPTPAKLAESLVVPATVASLFTVPTPSTLAASLVTPATVASVFTVPTPLAGLIIVVITTGRGLHSMFYRNTVKDQLALVPIGTGVPSAYKRSEQWERVSSRFVMNQGTADAVMALTAAAWAAHSEASQATLLAAINQALQTGGYRAPGGADLV